MARSTRRTVGWVGGTIVCVAVAGGATFAQGVLTQLGLTERAARNYVIAEVKNPTETRRALVVSAGRAGFLTLPPAARGPAAATLFAWAKDYANSAAFKAAYDTHRKGMAPTNREYAMTVEEEIKKEIGDQLAGLEQSKQAAASFPPAERAPILASVREAETRLRSGEMAKLLRAQKEEERARDRETTDRLVIERDEKFPADLQKFFAMRLRDFLGATADVNFAAKTINLTGGTEGIEFIDAADRGKPWQWQEAAVVGREATTAARAAAEAWLKEIER